MTEANENLPVPDLDPRPITLEENLALTPEKLELVSGYLIDGPNGRNRGTSSFRSCW